MTRSPCSCQMRLRRESVHSGTTLPASTGDSGARKPSDRIVAPLARVDYHSDRAATVGGPCKSGLLVTLSTYAFPRTRSGASHRARILDSRSDPRARAMP